MPETETDPKVAALAAVLDPDVFDDDKPKSTRQAALIQWAARRYMATEKAERAIAAGWVSPEEAKAREAAARREALLEAAESVEMLEQQHNEANDRADVAEAKVARVEALAEEWANDQGILSPDSRYTRNVLVHELRAALAEPERDEEGGRDGH